MPMFNIAQIISVERSLKLGLSAAWYSQHFLMMSATSGGQSGEGGSRLPWR